MTENDVKVLTADADDAKTALANAGAQILGAFPTPSGAITTIVTQNLNRDLAADALEAASILAYTIVTIRP